MTFKISGIINVFISSVYALYSPLFHLMTSKMAASLFVPKRHLRNNEIISCLTITQLIVYFLVASFHRQIYINPVFEPYCAISFTLKMVLQSVFKS